MKKNFTAWLLLNLVVFSLSAEVIWTEDFDNPLIDGKGAIGVSSTQSPIIDLSGITKWTINTSGAELTAPTDYFMVADQRMSARDVDGPVVWTTEIINISAYSSVRFSLDAIEIGDHEASNDYLDVEYSINGGSFIKMTNYFGDGSSTHTLVGDASNGITIDDDWQNIKINKGGLIGNTLQIRITISNGADAELITFDNVKVSEELGASSTDLHSISYVRQNIEESEEVKISGIITALQHNTSNQITGFFMQMSTNEDYGGIFVSGGNSTVTNTNIQINDEVEVYGITVINAGLYAIAESEINILSSDNLIMPIEIHGFLTDKDQCMLYNAYAVTYTNLLTEEFAYEFIANGNFTFYVDALLYGDLSFYTNQSYDLTGVIFKHEAFDDPFRLCPRNSDDILLRSDIPTITLGAEESTSLTVNAKSKEIQIIGAKGNLKVYDLSGHMIYSKSNPQSNITIPLSFSGVYLVQSNNEVKKVLVK